MSFSDGEELDVGAVNWAYLAREISMFHRTPPAETRRAERVA